MTSVTVVVATYRNSGEQLRQLSTSIAAAFAHAGLSKDDARVLSIDNGYSAPWPENSFLLTAVPSRGNIGFGAAINLLTNNATPSEDEVFVLANPDGAFHYGCIEALLDQHRRHPLDIIEAIQFPEEHPKSYNRETGETGWASGACLLIPRKTFDRVGKFDESFFLYMEDIDLSWRVRLLGFGVRTCARAIYMHDVIEREMSAKSHEHILISTRALAHKWHGESLKTRAEAELRRHGWDYSLPPLPEPLPLTSRLRAITDFGHPHLAPARW